MGRGWMVAVALVLGVGVTQPAEAAQVCGKDPVDGGYSKVYPGTISGRVAARTRWRNEVIDVFGAKFAIWRNARGKDQPCVRDVGAAGLRGWRCKAIGRPCAPQ